jgi:hypothetical protein
MKIGSRSLGELLYRTSGVIGTCKGLIGTSWGLPKSRNPTQTLCFPLSLPRACMGLWWDFHGLLMTIVIGLSPCGYGSHRTKKCRGRTSGWSAHTESRGVPSALTSPGEKQGRRPRHGVMASRQSHVAHCWYLLIRGRAVAMTQRKPRCFSTGVGTKSQQFHKKNSKKYVGCGLGLALRPCLEKNGRVKVCLES